MQNKENMKIYNNNIKRGQNIKVLQKLQRMRLIFNLRNKINNFLIFLDRNWETKRENG